MPFSEIRYEFCRFMPCIELFRWTIYPAFILFAKMKFFDLAVAAVGLVGYGSMFPE